MTHIKWNDCLSVNINVVDMQHKKLIDLINSFYDNIRMGTSKEELLKLITSLKDYAVMHFHTEEVYMKKLNYPDYQLHKSEHDSFVKTVQNFESRFVSGKVLISLEVTSFIKDWIIKHIMGTDKLCAAFLIKNGIK